MTYLEKSLTPQEALAHYGVKGMKWGVRNDDRSSSKPSTREIKDARERVIDANRQFYKDSKAVRRGEGTRKEKRATIADMRASALKDPDRMTAMRMTKGEKAAMAVFTVLAPPAAAGTFVVRAAVKRELTKAQQR